MGLHSHYLIDGVPQEMTPAELLDAVSECPHSQELATDDTMVVDESMDPSIDSYEWDSSKVDEYLVSLRSAKRHFPLPFAEMTSRGRVDEALIDSLWLDGHFRLEDLALQASWKWNESPVGGSAAFYRSVKATADYVEALGICLDSYSYESASECDLDLRVTLSRQASSEDDDFLRTPGEARPSIGKSRKCNSRIGADSSDWLVYIPFDTSDFRLGGSLLAQSMGLSGGVSMQLDDPDYFIDCFEVVRELVEDGIVTAAVSVSSGGLLAAVDEFCSEGIGATVDISGIVKAFEEKNIIRVLFSELPGVVIQIRDSDFDYLDAELLLQDVAFYPIGHPNPDSADVQVRNNARSGLQTILDALMQNAEGED